MDISHRTPGRVRRRRDIIMLVGESEQNRGAVLTLLIGVSTKWLTERPRSRMLMNDGGGAELRLLAGVGRRLRVLFPVYLPPALPSPAAARVVPGTAHCSARSPGARARQRGGWSFHGDATLLSFDAWNSTSGDRRREDVGQQLSSG